MPARLPWAPVSLPAAVLSGPTIEPVFEWGLVNRTPLPGTYFRSHALRSAATGKYVLWLNAQSCWGNTDGTGCPNGSANKCFAVGTSDSPTGPFMYQGIAPDVRDGWIRRRAEGGGRRGCGCGCGIGVPGHSWTGPRGVVCPP